MPIIQENPSYFEDIVPAPLSPPPEMHPFLYNHRRSSSTSTRKQTSTSTSSVPRGFLCSTEEDGNEHELDVFLSSCESTEFNKSETAFVNGCRNGRNGTAKQSGIGKKIGDFLWKSKSKHSLGSESHASSDPISPRFTPDSSLSIYTNSIESGSTGSANSNQISPAEGVNGSVNNNNNMFYKGMEMNYTGQGKMNGRSTSSSAYTRDYYHNPTFSTFPNPGRRRHSMSDGRNKLEQDHDGYLRPRSNNNGEGRNPKKQTSYVNEQQVHVDIHQGFETSDSQCSTVRGGSSIGSYIPVYQNGVGVDELRSPTTAEHQEDRNRNKFGAVCLSRIKKVIGSECEKYCSLCGFTSTLMGATLKSNMDVAIVSCQECFFSKNAESHIRLFLDKLVTPDKQKMDVKLQSYDLKDLEHSRVAADVHQSKVQIVIISHHFLQKLKLEASTRLRGSTVNRVFRSKRVIALLVGGVTINEITEGYNTILVRFAEWFWVELKSTTKLDTAFAQKFAQQFLKIYNLEVSTSASFSVFPKKVTREQPKIIIVLKNGLEEGDDVKVEFSCGKRIEGAHLLRIENPFTISVRVPGESLCRDKTSYVEVTLYVNSHKLGATCIKSDFQGGRLEDDEDVVGRMTRMVPGFSKLLDEHVKQALIRNDRECTDYRIDPDLELMNDVLICKGDEFPTMLHFACHYGLAETVHVLLEDSDGLQHLRVANENGYTPKDMAEQMGHTHVLQAIEDCDFVKQISGAMEAIKDIWCHRDSVVQLGAKKIVSNQTKEKEHPHKPAPLSFDNLPETDIILPDEDDSSSQHDGKSSSSASTSAGSYITWTQCQSITLNETSKPPPSPGQKPVPLARSPKSRNQHNQQTYVNVEGKSIFEQAEGQRGTEQEEEKVQLRQPRRNRKISRDPVRRKSLPPVEADHYVVPRPADQEYAVPPPGSRPVTPDKFTTLSSSISEIIIGNDPVLIKKNSGSLELDDGYLLMETPDEDGESSNEVLRCTSRGTFIAITRDDSYVKESAAELVPTSKSSSEASLPVEAPAAGTSSLFERKGSLPEPRVQLESVDEELIQLMKDFTSMGYTYEQIQLLFENWKSRPDVIESMEEKRKWIKRMQDDYNKLQKGGKGAKLMDKLLGVFGRRKNSASGRIESVQALPGASRHTTDNSNRLQTRPSFDQDNFGSNGSGLESTPSTSAPNTGSESSPSPVDASNSPRTHRYRNPLDRRNIPSYVPPHPKKQLQTSLSTPLKQTATNGHPDDGYLVPPPPRPVETPPIPEKPARAYPPSRDTPPPALPEKPSHLRYKDVASSGDESPPPPPPRTYMKPNPFNYIDYSSRTRDGSADSRREQSRSPAPYDNLKDDKGKVSSKK